MFVKKVLILHYVYFLADWESISFTLEMVHRVTIRRILLDVDTGYLSAV